MARSRRQIRTSGSSFDLAQLDRIFAKVQLGILLTAIVLIPLIVLPESTSSNITATPKTTFLRMLGTLQLGVLLSRLLLALTDTSSHRLTDSLHAIKSSRPAFAILLSAATVGVVSIISAAFSILPHQSWWGRNPAGFEAGEFSALMYIVLS
ncbi:MAG: hypothetical protein HOF01_11715, partial [Chloroflexi bacterium]|nr:hypothetical protein [Chloroflexota bacterium]